MILKCIKANNNKQVIMLDDANIILSMNQYCEMKLIVLTKIGTNEYDTSNNSDILPRCCIDMFEKTNAPSLSTFYKTRYLYDPTKKIFA